MTVHDKGVISYCNQICQFLGCLRDVKTVEFGVKLVLSSPLPHLSASILTQSWLCDYSSSSQGPPEQADLGFFRISHQNLFSLGLRCCLGIKQGNKGSCNWGNSIIQKWHRGFIMSGDNELLRTKGFPGRRAWLKFSIWSFLLSLEGLQLAPKGWKAGIHSQQL